MSEQCIFFPLFLPLKWIHIQAASWVGLISHPTAASSSDEEKCACASVITTVYSVTSLVLFSSSTAVALCQVEVISQWVVCKVLFFLFLPLSCISSLFASARRHMFFIRSVNAAGAHSWEGGRRRIRERRRVTKQTMKVKTQYYACPLSRRLERKPLF